MCKLWGKSIEEPTFIVKNISIESIKITHKKEGFCYVTQFTYNGVCFKKVFSSQKVFEEITRTDLLKFGRSQLLGRHKVLTVDERERVVFEITTAVEYLKRKRV